MIELAHVVPRGAPVQMDWFLAHDIVRTYKKNRSECVEAYRKLCGKSTRLNIMITKFNRVRHEKAKT